jgi:ribosome biogenesis protein ENP2
MKLSNSSTVPVYTVSGSSTARPLPEWLSQQRRRSLKRDPEYANRVELLQDFEFQEASQCVRISEDGQWVMSTGLYSGSHHVENVMLISPQAPISLKYIHTTCLTSPCHGPDTRIP